MRTLFFEVIHTLIRTMNFESEAAKLLRLELNLRVPNEELINKVRSEWNNKYNALISKGVYRSTRQLAREVVLAIVKHYLLSLNPQELSYFSSAISSTIVETAELYDDAIDIIEKLNKANISMYILTNLDNDIAKKILLRFNLLRYFKGVISSDLTRAGKPSAKIFQAALSRARVSKDDTMIVSGLVEDIIGAKLVGIKVVYVDRLNMRPAVKPDYEVNSLSKIPELVVKHYT